MDPHQGQPADALIGQTVGNYLVTQKLGEGGMGSVYLAEHPSIGKKVALKVLHAEFSNNEEVAKRFFDEAKSVNNIGHPNIVDIVDYGVIQSAGRDQLVYFIMEYLAGQTLSDVIRRESPLPPERALTIALQVADALGASHRCNIVHRDLKPDNIILLQRGRERDFVKLLDFGIAKLTDSSGVSSHKTRTGIVMGTPAYMSPEQCEGRPNVDSRTDIYALGIVLYEMLTGRVPFLGEGYGEILVQHLTQNPIPPSQYQLLDPRIESVVLKALAKRPDLRYPTMEEFSRAMADPFGYVDAHGGSVEFLQRQLMPSNAPLPPTRPSLPVFTPPPGSLSTPTGMRVTGAGYGAAPNVPTTLGAAAGQVAPKKSKTGFMIAAVAILGAAGGGIAFVASQGGDKTETVEAATGGSDEGSATEQPVPETGSGSATTKTVETGSGSAVATNAGSGSAMGSGSQAVASNAGSADAGSGAGSGSAAGSAAVIPAVSTLTFTTKPAGAAIFVDGVDTKKRTPEPIEVPRSVGAVKIDLKLDGYLTYTLENFGVGKDITKSFTLKKKSSGAVVPTGSGTKNTGKGSGAGAGSGFKDKDGLERPD
ncbi:MAG: serine/threonine-protein kinase [Kofleriaceae bacterium]|nr:serine/threonine-protein kinase [Kofleriaceae bacterium]